MSATAALVARSFAIGFALAAPVGAMGVLCIRRTLAEGRVAGLATGLGIATGDAIYAGCAALGVFAAADALGSWQVVLRVIGGAALVLLGARTWRAEPAACGPVRVRRSGMYASALALTLTNPSTILVLAALLAATGLTSGTPGVWEPPAVVGGVFAGSLTWWLVLVATLGALRSRVTSGVMRAVNRVSGVVLAGFGIVAIGSVIW